MEKGPATFNRTYWLTCCIVLVIVIYRCVFVPFAHDEVATFYYYIQPGKFIPFMSHVDAMGHFLTCATSWVCFELFGSSVFTLRLPCIFGFMLLCLAVYRINGLFSGVIPKILLSSAFILCFNFISFYSLCRGYGISMSLLLFSFCYYIRCYREFSPRWFFLFILFSQLALSANLTLVFVLAIAGGFLLLRQIVQKHIFKPGVIAGWLVNFVFIVFWVKYAFYLQENGALYYGSGESYWRVTFLSLIETIAFRNNVLNAVVLIVFLEMTIFAGYAAYKERKIFNPDAPFRLIMAILWGLIISFYLLKKLFGVNYPEDRTGLFFYVFFVLALAFMVNELKRNFQAVFLLFPLFFFTDFIYSVNVSIHPWRIYETFPESFLSKLREEQKKAGFKVTVGGHRVREFVYGFMNYNSGEKLNHITAPEALQMNCDYAIAYKQDKPWYDKYYSELAVDDYWDFILLKRRRSIARKLLYRLPAATGFEGSHEYFNAYERLDISFNSANPLMAEFNFGIDGASKPFRAWLVLQIDGDDGNNVFVRTPLDLIKYDWNGTGSFTTCITSGNIPVKIKRIVAYLWNIEKTEVKFRLNSFRLYQLDGEGITEVSQANL